MPGKTKMRESVLERVEASLRAVSQAATPRNVHFFRTSSRRLEAYAELGAGPAARRLRKLSIRFERPRKLAGRVRDLDVQMELLRGLQLERDRDARRRLLAELAQRRDAAERKLAKELDAETVSDFLQRISKAKRAERQLGAEPGLGLRERAWDKAQELCAALPQEFPSVEEKNLHKLRLAAKAVRYTAEQAFPLPAARDLAGAMKEVQDAIGRWHDWMILRKRARGVASSDSVLCRRLRDQERASLKEALRLGRSVTRARLGHAELPHVHPAKKSPAAQTAAPTAAATAS
jgi:CHAD domain-containing protein